MAAEEIPVPDTAVETPETSPETTPETIPEGSPHPLEEGGKRFNQVYARMKEAERDAMEMRDRVARLEGQAQVAARPTAAPQKTYYEPQELQVLVDQGRISPAVMADQLAWQRTQQGIQQVTQTMKWQQTAQTALAEVHQYIEKLPSLAHTTSPEFAKVARAAHEIADEMGLRVEDPRVQRRALRETFGTLDKMTKVEQAGDFNRAHADTHVETGRGGGQSDRRGAPDPLKGVPKAQIEFWKSKGYSQKQMEAEAPFVKRRA